MNVADAVDKCTILLIKKEHGLKVARELQDCLPYTKGECSSKLYDINSLMWDVEELVSEETNLCKLGAYCLALRWLNTQRIAAKNKISEALSEHLERKTY